MFDFLVFHGIDYPCLHDHIVISCLSGDIVSIVYLATLSVVLVLWRHCQYYLSGDIVSIVDITSLTELFI